MEIVQSNLDPRHLNRRDAFRLHMSHAALDLQRSFDQEEPAAGLGQGLGCGFAETARVVKADPEREGSVRLMLDGSHVPYAYIEEAKTAQIVPGNPKADSCEACAFNFFR